MRVCVLSDGYPPWERGGAQKIAAQLARGYHRRGHRVSVVTAVTDRSDVGLSTVDGVSDERSESEARRGAKSFETAKPFRDDERREASFEPRNDGVSGSEAIGGSSNEQSEFDGIEVHRVYSPKPRALLPHLTVYNPFVVRPCRRLLDRIGPEVVHVHNCHWLSNGALRAAADGRPVVKTYHDAGTVAYGDFDGFVERVPVGSSRVASETYELSPRRQAAEQGLRYNPLRNRSNRKHLRRCVDVGVAVSRELRRALTANGMPCQAVIRNGVEPDYWAGGDGDAFRRRYGLGDSRIVLFGGRTSEAKGGRHLARAVARLDDQVAGSVHLVVTGDEEFADEMRREMGDRGDRLVATGWVDPEAYRDAMDAAAVVASPSVFLDPFPTVNLEAFAASTPVVTTRFGGGSELVDHGENGFVVDPRDGDVLADALRTLVGDPETATAFGNAGRRKVTAEFRVEQQVDAYLSLLDAARGGQGEFPEALGGDVSPPGTGQ